MHFCHPVLNVPQKIPIELTFEKIYIATGNHRSADLTAVRQEITVVLI